MAESSGINDMIARARAEATAKRLAASKSETKESSVAVTSPTGGTGGTGGAGTGRAFKPAQIVRENPMVAEAPPPAAAPSAPVNPLSAMALMPGIQDPTGDMQRVLAGSLTRGGSDYLTSLFSGNSVEAEKQLRTDARERTGLAGDAMAVAGTVAPYFMLPSALGATAVRAGATGGVTSVADASIENYISEGKLPSLKEIGMTMAMGTVFGVGGYYVAKLVQANGPKPTVTQQTQKGLESVVARENAFTLALSNPKVSVNKKLFTRLADRLEKNLQTGRDTKAAYRSNSQGSYARAAINRLRRIGDGGANPTFGEVADEVMKIRNSIRNSDHEVIAPVRDEAMVEMIYKEADALLEGLPATKGLEVWNRPALGSVVEGYRGVKELGKLRDKTTITLGIFKRAASAADRGMPYDKAVQSEFATFLRANVDTGKVRGAVNLFTPDELKAFQGMAHGGAVTRHLNHLDRAFGHGLLGDFYRVYPMILRRFPSAAAEAEARRVASMVNPATPELPSIMPQVRAAQTGAAAPAVANEVMEPEADKFVGAPKQ